MALLKFFRLSEWAYKPTKTSENSAGYDLHSADYCTVKRHSATLVHTDLAFEFPENCYGRIAARSGQALNAFIDIGGGVIDNDYRGRVGVIIHNHSREDFKIKRGDRIAQLICESYVPTELQEVQSRSSLSTTVRNTCGFGSSGTR
jgi:dUTP pyrophosphatase